MSRCWRKMDGSASAVSYRPSVDHSRGRLCHNNTQLFDIAPNSPSPQSLRAGEQRGHRGPPLQRQLGDLAEEAVGEAAQGREERCLYGTDTGVGLGDTGKWIGGEGGEEC